MDKLKDILNAKKAQAAEKKIVKLGDIEKERAEQHYKEQQEKERKKQEKFNQIYEADDEYYKELEKKKKKNPAPGFESNLLSHELEDHDGEPPIPKSDIIKRLRSRKVPITLFGETDWMRYERLRRVETEKMDDDVRNAGQENIYRKDMELSNEDFMKMADIDDEVIPYEKLVEYLDSKKKIVDFNTPEFKGRKKGSISQGITEEEKCVDIYYWCKKVLMDWEKEIPDLKEEVRILESDESKSLVGQYRQCRRHIKPLFMLLRSGDLHGEIVDALYHVVHYCMMKEYVRGHDKYLEISIGNAPWPMGVTSVSIHERSGRSRIFTSQIAHILNDETQRKYLQAIKRLMTVAQKQNPNEDYTKNINV